MHKRILGLSLKTFFVLVLLASLPSLAAADVRPECNTPSEHSAITYLLIDRSDELESVDNLKQSLTVVDKMLEPGERLIVGVSTGKASDTRVLMDMVRPKPSLWESKLKTRAAEKKFNDCFKSAEALVIEQNESYKTSALLETLGIVSKALASDPSKSKRVIVYSDMIQNSPSLSFYSSQVVNTDQALKKAEKEFLMSSFPGVQFHIAGVGNGVSDKKARSIEAFWKAYFEKNGGTLKYYGPVLFAS